MADINTDMDLVLRTEHGRRVIKNLLDSAGVDSVVFTGDYGKDCFNQGKQALGIKIKRLAKESNFDAYIELVKD